MLAIIIFAQPADDYSPARAGMDEFPVLQVDAYMGNFLSRTVAAEEYQVTFLEIPFGYLIAFIFQLFRVSRYLGTIYFPVYLINHARTVGSPFRISAATVRSAYPVGGFQIEFMIVLKIDVYTQ